jgi:hypothetical protein
LIVLRENCVRNSPAKSIFAALRLFTDPKMQIDKKQNPVNATNCPAQIVITVTPDKRPDRYRAYFGSEEETLCVSRQPFFDGARELIARGHDPLTILVMKWAGAKDWALRGRLGAAAKLTVDEHNATFAKWKPFSRSAGSSRIAKSADKLSQGCNAERAVLESNGEKAGE